MSQTHTKADQYNDPSHNYREYWRGRDYEDAAERLAIERLLKGRHFKNAVDVGGGYGRLCVLLEQFAEHVILAEPSQQQLDIAQDFLKDHPEIERKLMQADALQLADSSVDLLTLIRVMHHLPDPAKALAEISRVLAPDGLVIIEMANYLHARNRLKLLLKGQKMPIEPVDIRSSGHRTTSEIPFVNHNPHTVLRQLTAAGLRVEKVLSVSNLRSPTLKKIIPTSTLLSIEKLLQPLLVQMYFGPSVFFLARKAK